MRFSVSVLAGVVATGLCLESALPAETGQAILSGIDRNGGLVVHLGCGDGKLTADLCGDGRFLVQGLDADPDNVAAARRHVRSRGLYGRVSIDHLDGKQLPFIDNLVTLVVADETSVPMTRSCGCCIRMESRGSAGQNGQAEAGYDR